MESGQRKEELRIMKEGTDRQKTSKVQRPTPCQTKPALI